MKALNIKGDTIVEVLIAITVMSSILGGAFVSARRSTNATRASQERVEALAVAQGQLERARTAPGTLPECYDPDGNERSNPDDCKVNGLYVPQIDIASPQLVTGFNDLLVTVSWEGVGGIGPQQLELVYRQAAP
ncbi:hypothetical protein KA068_00115 [Candidatus Saccharibacteria bacterium]|jgi:type II secretory pathway pseudopilin PulG|nr:hypothetical protein [Candidatus Saccharibacteria bacterium]